MAANIHTYDAKSDVLRPDEKGFAAFETAGRRIPGAYDQVATDYRRIGQLQAQGIEGRKWPFDILALQQTPKAIIRVKGGVNPGGGLNPLGGGDTQSYRNISQIATGAGALGDQLGAVPSPTDGGLLIDVNGGTRSIGRKTVAGTFDPTRLIDVGAATGQDNLGGAGIGIVDPGDQTDSTNGRDTTNVPGRTYDPSTGQFTDPGGGVFSGLGEWMSNVFGGGGGSGGDYNVPPTDTPGDY